MGIGAVGSLIEELRRYRLLEPSQLDQLTSDLKRRLQASSPSQRLLRGRANAPAIPLPPHFANPETLTRELQRRGWLTAFQVERLSQQRTHELLLGSYVLLEHLGEGGMGTVFKARNCNLGRIVALKVIRKERLMHPEALQRFRREIRAAGKLSHPHLVYAYDADCADGKHFLVMEYVDGTDLARWVSQSGPLPVQEACAYMRQAALGLAFVHEQGLVHRDIKPSNLLRTSQGGLIKILDLGLARLVMPEHNCETSSEITQNETTLGTPDFMAPEQVLDAHAIDGRADIYSLGCTFYFLLTGTVPFPATNTMRTLFKQCWQEPTPLEQVVPGMEPEVGALVKKMMAKRPESRFQTASEVATELAALSFGPPRKTHTPPAAVAGSRRGTVFSTLRARLRTSSEFPCS